MKQRKGKKYNPKKWLVHQVKKVMNDWCVCFMAGEDNCFVWNLDTGRELEAIDQHIKLHGEWNLGHEVLHKVQYRGVTKWVEVTTRRCQYSACVMNGKRELQRICYAES